MSILSKLERHPNIITLFEVFETKTRLLLVLELATGGTLQDKVALGALSEVEAQHVTAQVASALEHMHRAGVTHRDLKPENILFERDVAKVTDFGLASMASSSQLHVMRTRVGTETYVAPEVLRGDDYGPSVDVWSLGIIVYAMLCGSPPFKSDHLPKLFQQISRARLEFPEAAWAGVSPQAKDLLQQLLLVPEPAHRGSARDVLDHKWLYGVARPKPVAARGPVAAASQDDAADAGADGQGRLTRARRNSLQVATLDKKHLLMSGEASPPKLGSRRDTVQVATLSRPPLTQSPPKQKRSSISKLFSVLGRGPRRASAETSLSPTPTPSPMGSPEPPTSPESKRRGGAWFSLTPRKGAK